MRFLPLLIAVCPLSLLASLAAGEAPPGGVQGLAQTALDATVQKSLELTDKQIAAAMSASELLQKVRDGKAQAMAREKLEGALTMKQLHRLEQIHWQRLGGLAILEPKVAKALTFSDEQQQRIKAARAENAAAAKEMRDFMARARFASKEAMEAYMDKYRVAASERLLAVLTAKQRKQLSEMCGEPFGQT